MAVQNGGLAAAFDVSFLDGVMGLGFGAAIRAALVYLPVNDN
jgi:hypothetical protein